MRIGNKIKRKDNEDERIVDAGRWSTRTTHTQDKRKERDERDERESESFEFIFLKIQTYDIFLQVKTNLVTYLVITLRKIPYIDDLLTIKTVLKCWERFL